MLFGKICSFFKLPSLVGMLIAGILLGSYGFNLLDPSVQNISIELRQIALIIILMRAGLNLNLKDLKKVGRPALLMCFVPACFEIIGTTILAPVFFDITYLEATVLGTVIAAVSPAVIIPRMIELIEKKKGTEKGLPQLIMVGASMDDIFVIILFTSFLGLLEQNTATANSFLVLPTSLILGLAVGIGIGLLSVLLFRKFHMRDSVKILVILSISFLLLTGENMLKDLEGSIIGFSGLLAVMAIGSTLKVKKKAVAERLSAKFSRLWVGAEVLLFVLVGATVNPTYALRFGFIAIILIILVVFVRLLGVFCCLIGTKFNKKEKLFIGFSYMPKATVQAAIGGLPLAANLACGELILTIAVLSILITAPVGAYLMDRTYNKLL